VEWICIGKFFSLRTTSDCDPNDQNYLLHDCCYKIEIETSVDVMSNMLVNPIGFSKKFADK
jgi:hypothetical protein